MAKKKKINTVPILVIGVVVVLLGGAVFLLSGSEINYYGFTSCLAGSGLIEVGSDSCLHCENQKRILGHDAFKKNFDDAGNYLRCNLDPLLCSNLDIRGTPTWYMPSETGKPISAQGSKYAVSGNYVEYLGEQSIPKLAEISGCQLPENYDPSKGPLAGGYSGA